MTIFADLKKANEKTDYPTQTAAHQPVVDPKAKALQEAIVGRLEGYLNGLQAREQAATPKDNKSDHFNFFHAKQPTKLSANPIPALSPLTRQDYVERQLVKIYLKKFKEIFEVTDKNQLKAQLSDVAQLIVLATLMEIRFLGLKHVSRRNGNNDSPGIFATLNLTDLSKDLPKEEEEWLLKKLGSIHRSLTTKQCVDAETKKTASALDPVRAQIKQILESAKGLEVAADQAPSLVVAGA